jgi:RNA polymerase-binding transcription factor DksA
MTNHDFESALDAISVAFSEDNYTLCIKLCSDALLDQNSLTEATKTTLLQFVINSSEKLLNRSTAPQGMTDTRCSFCDKQPPSVRLGAGPSAFICNECVELFSEALKQPIPAG